MKATRLYVWPLLILLSLSNIGKLEAQENVKQVSIKESYHSIWEDKVWIWVDANHAEIECHSYDGDSILVEIEIISRHIEKTIAAKDLKKMKFVSEKIGSKLFYRNYIELKRDEEKPKSNIQVFYRIKVPYQTRINIKNYFGEIIVKDFQNELRITSNYSPISIDQFSGKLSIETTFGDINAKSLKGKIKIKSNRSNVFIDDLSGELHLDSKIAELRIENLNEVSELKINAAKSKLFLNIPKPEQYSYQLDLEKTKLILPQSIPLEFIKNEKDIIKAHYNMKESVPILHIELNIGVLTIKTSK